MKLQRHNDVSCGIFGAKPRRDLVRALHQFGVPHCVAEPLEGGSCRRGDGLRRHQIVDALIRWASCRRVIEGPQHELHLVQWHER